MTLMVVSRTVAVVPTKAKMMSAEDVTRICHTWALDGLRAINESNPGRPLRFVYLSGSGVERDQAKRPWILADYLLMRVSYRWHSDHMLWTMPNPLPCAAP